ncbi:UNKNOWN [Stylonychia lemnae]|uniref:Uncharacterized protein n=1 Tax=Stylonychia lemnae TaxID=5949 RepID=A0A078BEB6_STYLE|nr:UNKNOWN [Stylonychia lemnae]|eukprot:CDW91482.1 UNKNOWN [Stylonychia lemnae]
MNNYFELQNSNIKRSRQQFGFLLLILFNLLNSSNAFFKVITNLLDRNAYMTAIKPQLCFGNVENNKNFIDIDFDTLGGGGFRQEQAIKKGVGHKFIIRGKINRDVSIRRHHIWIFREGVEVHYKNMRVMEYYYDGDDYYYEMMFELPNFSTIGGYRAVFQSSGLPIDDYVDHELFRYLGQKEFWRYQCTLQEYNDLINKDLSYLRPRKMERIDDHDPVILGCIEFWFHLV